MPADKISDATAAVREASSMSVFCRTHPLAVLRPDLRKLGVVTARQLRSLPSGRKVRVSGLLVIVHTPPTKSGKRVIFMALDDETGLWDAVMFPKVQKDFARVVYTSELLTVEGRLQRQGKNGLSISVVVERVILPWSGRLSKFLHDIEDTKGKEREENPSYDTHLVKGNDGYGSGHGSVPAAPCSGDVPGSE